MHLLTNSYWTPSTSSVNTVLGPVDLVNKTDTVPTFVELPSWEGQENKKEMPYTVNVKWGDALEIRWAATWS